jgi:hypothetical protein
LGILRPNRDFSIWTPLFENVLSFYTAGRIRPSEIRDYTIIVGEIGRAPVLFEAAEHPFRKAVRIGSMDVEIRMESWLPSDTIRRAGFGQVILNRRHLLTLERGISFIAFDGLGTSSPPSYQGGIFEPIPQLLVRAPGNPF